MGHSARVAEAMSAADPAGTSELIARVLADQPDVVAALDEAHQAAWSATDARLLEMCRIRAAQLIGCTAEAEARMPGVEVSAAVLDALPSWPSSSLFDDVDRAVLAWCEVAPLRAHLGDAGLVDLTNALLVIEQRQRLRCTWEVLW
jgi:alkylhydroperoxidase family enzyme